MRQLLWLVILAALTRPVFAQSKPTPEQSSPDEKAIQQIEDDLLNAERATNPAAYERVLADDFVNLVSRGLGPSKADILSDFRRNTGKTPPYTTETENMHIFILGDTAVAAYTKIYTAKENGNVAREDNTHIFRKEQGVWKLKLSRETLRGSELE